VKEQGRGNHFKMREGQGVEKNEGRIDNKRDWKGICEKGGKKIKVRKGQTEEQG
jgi:hypothetical protein